MELNQFPQTPQTPLPPVDAFSRNTKVIKIIIGIALAVILLAAGGYFIVTKMLSEKGAGQPFGSNALFGQIALAKRLIQPSEIISTVSDVKPQVPAYSLPLNISKDIYNFDKLSQKIDLSDSSKNLLSKNGFVVIDGKNKFRSDEDFAGFYSEIQGKDLPVFVTTDSLLHYYHVFFDTSLMRMEKDIFYNDAWQMSKRFYDDSLNIYQNAEDPILKEAARRNVAYLSVELELLKPKPSQTVSSANVKNIVDCYGDDENCKGIYDNIIQEGAFSVFGQKEANQYSFNTPDFVKDLVDKELLLIDKHDGWNCSPTALYEEDYSQYIPRGHYTKSEKLKNYFKAFMWYGRMTDLVKGSSELPEGQCSIGGARDGFISAKDAQIQTIQASILARKFASDVDIQKSWKKIYAITSFYVGFSDDLGPVEYGAALSDVFGDNVNADSLAAKVDKIQKTIKEKFPKPQIYSGLGNAQMVVVPQPPLTQEQIDGLKKQADDLLANTTGFRMMGQRFVVDSYLFSKIVSPYSGEYTGKAEENPFTLIISAAGRKVRGFPRGLDVMALFGSNRAQQIIKDGGDADYSNYQTQFDILKKEVDAIPREDWYKNLYWNWLYALKSLIGEFGSGYPSFMQTTAWQDKELSTALASWSQLRHDTILYAKQSYTMAEMGGGDEEIVKIVGYVEPVPDFYARLADLTKMTKKGLTNTLSKDEWDKVAIGDAMDQFEKILSRLGDISKTELENRELTEDDYYFIKYFGDSLKSISLRLLAKEGAADPDMFKTTLIADVHTDGNTLKVLEEGTGYVKPMVVAYKLPNNRIVTGVGPVFSYYEFKHPMQDRLTDEKWRTMLQSNHPAGPEWISSFTEQ